jgi:hypothetical protein
MKNTFFLAIAAFFATASVNAQSTVDSIAAKYKLLPMPEQMTLQQKFPVLGTYQLQGTTDSTASVSITLDSSNKGMVWVEGLPQGRIKAYLKKSPTTYRIIPQKTESGKSVPEGTLYYDAESNTLNVALGAPYNETDPVGIFALNPNANAAATTDVTAVDPSATVKVKTKTSTSKSKSKVSYYTATKLDQGTATTPVNQQQQQQQQ